MLHYLLSKYQLKAFQRSFLLSLELGKVLPPKFVALDCTRRCNLNCQHCGAKKERYRTELSTEKIKAVIDEMVAYGVTYLMVTGGEPLLREDLFEVFAHAKARGLKTGLATNGYLIYEKNAQQVSTLFDSIQCSLDGTSEAHNRIRANASSYERVMAAIGLLKKENAKQITVSSVITPDNIDDLEALGEIVRRLGIAVWKIIVPMPIGNAESVERYQLSLIEFKKLLEYVEQNRDLLHIEFGENLGYLGRYDKRVRPEAFFCPVGLLACCIGVDGKVRGCAEEPDTPYFQEGDLMQQSFREIWEKGFEKYRKQHLLRNEPCRDCRMKGDCWGGCWVMKLKEINCTVARYGLE